MTDKTTAWLVLGVIFLACCCVVSIVDKKPPDYVSCFASRVSWCSGKGCDHAVDVCRESKP